MRVSKAKQEDVPSVARVHVAAWQACYRGIIPKDFLDRSSPDQDKDASQVGQVYAIYVTPEFWGKRCGHVLWRRVVKELVAAKFEELNVWVLEANQRARRFYEREGYELTPKRR